ncbi:MAG: T9SS type A sorting domain-containing protein [Ignavibacteria bacterium]|jgi:hypothetical protein
MKKILISFLFAFIFFSSAYPQSVRYIIPDSGYQGTNFPVTIIGDATEWMASNYFQIFFDSTGVTADFIDSTNVPNDTTIYTTIHISGKAVTIPRTIFVLDKFNNTYKRDSALKVLLSLPSIPVLILPPDNATNQLQYVTLLWDSNAYAASFRIQISADSTFSTTYFDSSVANTPLQMPPGFLQLGTKYFWRVNATNIMGTSEWSGIWDFTIRTIGVKQISSEIPNSFKLLDNYPNPFNPNTIIRFQIKDTRFVSLKVYDLLGKEISILVNEKKSPGIYEVNFNGSNFASGVYFYRIQTGDFMQVKKMLLIK